MTVASGSGQSVKRTVILSIFLLIACGCFVALGIWQIERLGWKQALIARVESRVNAPPSPAPSKSEWNKVNRADDEYRHVDVTGVFDHTKETYVYASTELGPGYWVLTPLTKQGGDHIFINRGFVPLDKKEPSTRADGQPNGPVTITGLLRINEPNGTFLRANVPDADRWYSRDVEAIAAKRGIKDVAPYFIDADKNAIEGTYPVGGLTQIKFPNSHLQYAITWFAMAAMTVVFMGFLLKTRKRPR